MVHSALGLKKKSFGLIEAKNDESLGISIHCTKTITKVPVLNNWNRFFIGEDRNQIAFRIKSKTLP